MGGHHVLVDTLDDWPIIIDVEWHFGCVLDWCRVTPCWRDSRWVRNCMLMLNLARGSFLRHPPAHGAVVTICVPYR